MKAGTEVWSAAVVGGDVVVERALTRKESRVATVVVDRPLVGAIDRCAFLDRIHATRTAALEALAERLEQEAQRERAVASEHLTRAERCLINAQRARKMAEGR